MDVWMGPRYGISDEKDIAFINFAFSWLERLVKSPCHFRCGFDIVLPWQWKIIPQWFIHIFNGRSIIRIKYSRNVEWVGFVFCVAFEVNNHPLATSGATSGSPLPYPFYLSFESEHTEERFDMPLSLERHMVDGKSYLWTIYISRDHCHFVKTGAQITFKAQQGLIVNQWGLQMLTKNTLVDFEFTESPYPLSLVIDHVDPPLLVIDHVEESSSSIFEPKIQLPYNWFVSDEDEIKNEEAKRKEIDLSNLGLLTT